MFVHLFHLHQKFADTSSSFSLGTQDSFPYFALPELLVLFNNHSGLNYTFEARKDASPSHNHMPAYQLHRPVEGPGSLDSAMFPEPLAEQDSPYGHSNTGLSEPKGKYNLLHSLGIYQLRS